MEIHYNEKNTFKYSYSKIPVFENEENEHLNMYIILHIILMHKQ